MDATGKARFSRGISFLLVFVFFALVFYFQYWLEALADYPYDDEYYSLLTGLGLAKYYSTSLYVRLLSILAIFFNTLESLHRYNFFVSHLVLGLGFFFYHSRRNINLGTNFFFTSMLVLSPLNILLSRKIHFWAAGFFFIILGLSTYLKGNARNFFLFFSLLLLGFFRVEFFFSAVLALGCIICYQGSFKKIFFLSFLITLILIFTVFYVLTNTPGAQALLDASGYRHFSSGGGSFLKGLFDIVLQMFKNILVYSSVSFETFISTLTLYFISLINSFVFLFFILRPIKENILCFYQAFKNDFLLFYFPAILALISIRFFDAYLIMFYALLLSGLAFLMNSRGNRYFLYVIFILLVPAFCLKPPDLFKGFEPKLLYRRMYLGKFDRSVHAVVEKLAKSSNEKPYRILSYQPLSQVYSSMGHQFFLFKDLKALCDAGDAHFDVVALHNIEEMDLVKKCLLPRLQDYKIINLSENAQIFMSDRVSP